MDEVKTVLIVDDAVDNRVVYGLCLEHFGYRVILAHDGYEGVQQARAEHPDLILMDISMPVLDGIEATRLIRADEHTASIPIIAVTAPTDPATRVRAEESGCNAFLGKPVGPSQLARQVERFLGPGSEMQSTPERTTGEEPSAG